MWSCIWGRVQQIVSARRRGVVAPSRLKLPSTATKRSATARTVATTFSRYQQPYDLSPNPESIWAIVTHGNSYQLPEWYLAGGSETCPRHCSLLCHWECTKMHHFNGKNPPRGEVIPFTGFNHKCAIRIGQFAWNQCSFFAHNSYVTCLCQMMQQECPKSTGPSHRKTSGRANTDPSANSCWPRIPRVSTKIAADCYSISRVIM